MDRMVMNIDFPFIPGWTDRSVWFLKWGQDIQLQIDLYRKSCAIQPVTLLSFRCV